MFIKPKDLFNFFSVFEKKKVLLRMSDRAIYAQNGMAVSSDLIINGEIGLRAK